MYGAMRYPRDVVKFASLTFSEHPTQKPVELMEWLVRSYSCAGDLIVDPYMGSGSTGVAAVSNGRRFVGVELETKFFDIACRNLERAVRAAQRERARALPGVLPMAAGGEA